MSETIIAAKDQAQTEARTFGAEADFACTRNHSIGVIPVLTYRRTISASGVAVRAGEGSQPTATEMGRGGLAAQAWALGAPMDRVLKRALGTALGTVWQKARSSSGRARLVDR